ncbi:MAG: ribonuclease J, partial [Clostridia bacterium]|nr:ribonuclease J [Clostridia bacterium]
LGVVRPQFFIPVHGEQKHLRKHAMLAEAMGIAPQNIYVADNGVQIEISKDGIKELGQLPMEQIFVDGSGVGDVGNIVISDRKRLSENGIVVVVVSVDSVYGEIVSGPEIISRGFIYVRDNEQLIEEAKIISRKVVEDYMSRGIRDWPTIKNRVRDAVSRYMYEQTGRNPMILSIIMEV